MAGKRLIYSGKSKDVYEITDGEYAGKFSLVFTDKATGYIADDGTVVFDPGRDVVVGEIPGKGAIACRFAAHFFELLKSKGIPSHYITTISENEMIVEPADALSMLPQPDLEGATPLENLEFTWRNNATGSFWRRYPFVKPGQNLKCLVEIWTKGDVDVLITAEALEESGALSCEEIKDCIKLVQDIAYIVSEDFASKGLHVLDGKFELGRLRDGDGKIVIIEEISPDVLRVCDGYTPGENGDCDIWRECTVTSCKNGKRSIKQKRQVPAKDFVSVFL
ncbi:MAG: hypothetical protein GX804_01330 [Lentisphaerae bacterium]|nr:hypothetical protein [Lentisphaerota bacterium]